MLKLNEKEYLQATGKDCTDIKIELFYDLGGFNYWNGKKDARGYYISVKPVNREESFGGCCCESWTVGNGIKQLLLEVSRRSAAAEKKASEKLEEVKQQLIDYVCNKYGITLA